MKKLNHLTTSLKIEFQSKTLFDTGYSDKVIIVLIKFNNSKLHIPKNKINLTHISFARSVLNNFHLRVIPIVLSYCCKIRPLEKK